MPSGRAVLPAEVDDLEVARDHPVTWGLPPELAVFQTDDLASNTALPGAEMDRWVLATYPRSPKDVLLSGWMRGQERIARRAASIRTTTR